MADSGSFDAVVRDGLDAVARHWRLWLTIGHIAFMPVVAAYFLMVLGNSLAFDYSFWFDIPPSDQADTVAVVSIWLFGAFACLLGVVAYGWMCRVALSIVDNQRLDIWAALQVSLGSALRTSWYAVPAFALTAIGVLFIVPSVIVVPLFGTLPFPALERVEKPIRWHAKFVQETGSPLRNVGVVVGLFSLPLLVALMLEEVIRTVFRGWLQAIAVGPLWAAAAVVMVGAGTGAVLLARLYRAGTIARVGDGDGA